MLGIEDLLEQTKHLGHIELDIFKVQEVLVVFCRTSATVKMVSTKANVSCGCHAGASLMGILA
jgi:hypothetical protein